MNLHRSAVRVLALAAVLPLIFLSGPAPAQRPAAQIAAPRIDGFAMQPSGRLIPGKQLLFILYGSPGGSASVQLAGATKRVILEEVDAGMYLGAYTIGKRDRIGADATALATLRSGNRFISSGLDEPDKVTASASALPRVDRFAAARTQTPASRN